MKKLWELLGQGVIPKHRIPQLQQMIRDLEEIMRKLGVNNNRALFDRIDHLLAIEKSNNEQSTN